MRSGHQNLSTWKTQEIYEDWILKFSLEESRKNDLTIQQSKSAATILFESFFPPSCLIIVFKYLELVFQWTNITIC